MSKEHDADDVSEIDERTDSINRRRFVKGFSAVGSGLAFGRVASSSVAASPIDRKVEVLTGKDMKSVIKKIKTDPNVSLISDHMTYSRIQYSNGKYGLVRTDDGSEFNIATVPVESTNTNTNQDKVLQWSENSDEYTQIITLDQSKSIGKSTKDFKENTIWVENNSVKSSSNVYSVNTTETGVEITPESSIDENNGIKITPDQNTAPPGAGGICYRCGCKTVVSRHCTNWNLSCLAWKVAEIGASCNPWTGIVTCALGNILAWGPFVTGDNCHPCDHYDVSRTDIGYACS